MKQLTIYLHDVVISKYVIKPRFRLGTLVDGNDKDSIMIYMYMFSSSTLIRGTP